MNPNNYVNIRKFTHQHIHNILHRICDWEKYCHYGKKIDTYPIVTFLQDIGYLPMDLGRLTSLVEYFKIPMGQAHNAREDIKMNIEVYKKIKELMKMKKMEIANANHNSLLEIIEL